MTTTTTDSKVADAAGTAKDQAAQVAGTTASAAGDVAGTAKDQAAHVVGEAMSQTHDLVGQATDQLNTQATEQTQRLSRNIRRLAQHFSQMAGAGEQGSTAQSLVQNAAERADRAAGYLDGKQPGDLVSDLQNLGRRRPGAFLLGAAIAGVAVGRLAGAAKRATGSDTDSGTGTTTATGTTSQFTRPPTTPPTVATPPIADPVPPIRNVTPGAPTIEPYPDAAPGTGAL